MLDNQNKSQTFNIFGMIFSLIALEFTVYNQFKNPQTGTLITLGIMGFVAL